MSELSTTLIVIAAVLFVIVQGLGVASFVMLLMQSRRMRDLAEDNVKLKADNEKFARGQRAMNKMLIKIRKGQIKATAARASDNASLITTLVANKAEVVDGQFKLAELLTTGLKANTEYLNVVSKATTDSIFDAVGKNTDDVLKLGTENSQKVYDAVVVMIQMMNSLMTGMGFRPTAPTSEEMGLQDPKQGPNYNKPPAPGDQDGLTHNDA